MPNVILVADQTRLVVERRFHASLLEIRLFFLVAPMLGALSVGDAQPASPSVKQVHLKHVLVIGETKGFEHDSISAAMNAIYEMGKQTGLWDTMIRTDTELITKKDLGRNREKPELFRCYCLRQHHRRTRRWMPVKSKT